MTKLEPFYIYAVFGEDGEMKHSGISYGAIDPNRPPTQTELREALLISASFAEADFEWPEHDQPNGKQLSIKLYGPFTPGDPVDLLTAAEFHAIEEDDLP